MWVQCRGKRGLHGTAHNRRGLRRDTLYLNVQWQIMEASADALHRLTEGQQGQQRPGQQGLTRNQCGLEVVKLTSNVDSRTMSRPAVRLRVQSRRRI